MGRHGPEPLSTSAQRIALLADCLGTGSNGCPVHQAFSSRLVRRSRPGIIADGKPPRHPTRCTCARFPYGEARAVARTAGVLATLLAPPFPAVLKSISCRHDFASA